jgi:hypothetical protein
MVGSKNFCKNTKKIRIFAKKFRKTTYQASKQSSIQAIKHPETIKQSSIQAIKQSTPLCRK